MNVVYVPQDGFVSYDYSADGDVLSCTVDDVSDHFDFSDMTNGVATGFETILPHCPVVRAERKDGELIVYLLTWYWGSGNYDNRVEGDGVL